MWIWIVVLFLVELAVLLTIFRTVLRGRGATHAAELQRAHADTLSERVANEPLRERARQAALLADSNERLRRILHALPRCMLCPDPATHEVSTDLMPPGGLTCSAHAPAWSAAASNLDQPCRPLPWRSAVDALEPMDTHAGDLDDTPEPRRSLPSIH
jgi:hypothetical protein